MHNIHVTPTPNRYFNIGLGFVRPIPIQGTHLLYYTPTNCMCAEFQAADQRNILSLFTSTVRTVATRGMPVGGPARGICPSMAIALCF
jgi:hypothetical protein